MDPRQDVQTAAQQLEHPDVAARREAAATLHHLASARTSVLAVADALQRALADADAQVRSEAALALLIDTWRFQGLLPVLDALTPQLQGPTAPQVQAALVAAAQQRSDVTRAAAALLPILAQALPQNLVPLARLMGQGADLTPLLADIEASEPTPATPQGRELGALWLAILAKAKSEDLAARASQLRVWLDAAQTDWQYDDLRYRAAGLLAKLALGSGDEAQIAAFADDPRYPVREAAVDLLAAELVAGHHVAFALARLLEHVGDAAGGVRYSAIRGLARAVEAGVDLSAARHALARHLDDAAYLASGWTHPLDPIATSDLGAESAAADLAGAVAALARRAGDDGLLASLRKHPRPEVAAAADSSL